MHNRCRLSFGYLSECNYACFLALTQRLKIDYQIVYWVLNVGIFVHWLLNAEHFVYLFILQKLNSIWKNMIILISENCFV